MKLFHAAILLALALLSVGCVAPVTVEELDNPAPTGPISRRTIEDHRKVNRHSDHAAAGELIEGIETAQRGIEAGQWEYLEDYNYLVARLVEELSSSRILKDGPVELPSTETTYNLRLGDNTKLAYLHRKIHTADRVEFYGRHSFADAVKPGAGAPIISTRPLDADLGLELSDYYRNLTAVVRVRDSEAELILLDPYEVEDIQIGTRTYPLAANYSASASLMLSHERIDKLGLARLFNPSQFDNTARITAVQPYDPDRIPVLFVHGLQDSPATWAPMYFGLMADEDIRARYQFWTFSYPSGYPYPHSAAIFREQLAQVRELYPDHKDIVLIGHSMGGLISRLMVTTAGDRIWMAAFGAAPEETKIRGRSLDILTNALIFEAHPHIGRVIYIAAPHQGSEMADNWIGRMTSRLVKLPRTFANLRDDIINTATLDQAGIFLDRAPNSVDSLSTKSMFLREVNRISHDPSIPFHSIIGDLGLGSDGLVAYWSSHLDGATSEIIITANHFVHQHPKAVTETHRILRAHAGLTPVPLQLPQRNVKRQDQIKHSGPRSKR